MTWLASMRQALSVAAPSTTRIDKSTTQSTLGDCYIVQGDNPTARQEKIDMYHVAILANLKKNAPQTHLQRPDAWADLDSDKTIEGIAQALREGGHKATFLEANV